MTPWSWANSITTKRFQSLKLLEPHPTHYTKVKSNSQTFFQSYLGNVPKKGGCPNNPKSHTHFFGLMSMSISSCLLTTAESNPLLSWGVVGAVGPPWDPLAKVVQSGCVPTLFGLTGACCCQRHSCPSCVLTSCPLSPSVSFAQVASATCPRGTREVYSSTALWAGVRCLCKHASSSPLPLTATVFRSVTSDPWCCACLVWSCDFCISWRRD